MKPLKLERSSTRQENSAWLLTRVEVVQMITHSPPSLPQALDTPSPSPTRVTLNEAHYNQILKWARRWVPATEVQDVAQEVFCQALCDLPFVLNRDLTHREPTLMAWLRTGVITWYGSPRAQARGNVIHFE